MSGLKIHADVPGPTDSKVSLRLTRWQDAVGRPRVSVQVRAADGALDAEVDVCLDDLRCATDALIARSR